MGIEFTFYDYIDSNGINVIRNWLNGDGKQAKGYFLMMIPQLEASRWGSKDSVWGEPHTKFMKNKKEKWYGFIELRKEAKNVQYRLIAQMKGRSVFLVACGIHKEPNYITDVSPQTALSRVTQMINNPAKHRRPHEYN